ncbi:MAG TPA: hypothetical protein VJZ00_09340, partial [Thermoanaerobaculia bacterium]|nr:hypothetical protein [Thermoanaerobaculia bacterium]
NGEWIFYDSSNPKTDGLWRIPRAGGAAQLIVAGETIHPEVSADGEYVAFQRPEEGGTSAVEVVRVADRTVIPLATGISGPITLRVRWIGETHTVAFRALDEQGRIAIYAQTVGEPTRHLLVPGELTADTFAISPDGKHAILSVLDEASGLMLAELQ